MTIKVCPEHRHEHRQLPCPWPDCENAESAEARVEVPRHTGPGRMTKAEGHFEVPPPPRVFDRQQWQCEKCGKSGWTWVEEGAELTTDRCPHRRPGTVKPRPRS